MANNMVRVKPTVVTAHNNTLPSRNTASNTGTARKPASADNQDMVDQHQVTDKDHHKQAHQAAMDNKVRNTQKETDTGEIEMSKKS
jgi:hypothetical protein